MSYSKVESLNSLPCSADGDRAPVGLSATPRFGGWKDLWITPGVELILIGLSAACTSLLQKPCGFDFLGGLTAFLVFHTVWTLICLKILRMFFPFGEGVFNENEHPSILYRWKLYAFLCTNNLHVVFLLLPIILRQVLYKLLGCKIGRGIISIGGLMSEPHLVSIGENAIIGQDVLILPHALSTGVSTVLILAPVRIEREAVVGARSVVMPGTVIGAGAMIKSMSLVPMNTVVPAGEIWGGVPARKMGEVSHAI